VLRKERSGTYDAIVVGSGLGGLSAAALLAKAGRKTLVVEQHEIPGGYAHAFSRGEYLIDSAVHVLAQSKEHQAIQSLLRYLGVADRCTMIPLKDFCTVAFPGFRLRLPASLDGMIEAHIERFPRDADEIRAFFEICEQVFRGTHELPMGLSLGTIDSAVEQFPLLFRYRNATLSRVLEDTVSNPEVRAVLGASWCYIGLPPSQLAFQTFVGILLSTCGSPAYCEGSFQSLVDAFVQAVSNQGGELLLGTRVESITVESAKVAGVVLDDGRKLLAPVVISNADALQTFEQLVGHERLPETFMRRVRRIRPSMSACVIYAATTLDLEAIGATHETFMFRHWDHDDVWRDIMKGEPGGTAVSVPTLADPSLAPEGQHLVVVSSVASYEIGIPWGEAKPAYMASVLGDVDSLFPGFLESLVFSECATPETLERFTMNHRGATYGWDHPPGQIGGKRPSHETPVEGLYLSGAWTQPGSACIRVITSGIHTAQLIGANARLGELFTTFEHPDVPPVLPPRQGHATAVTAPSAAGS
jgi:prolycopene isomerase